MTPYTDALSKTLQLQGTYFYWDLENFPALKDSSRQIGLIAQDAPVIPGGSIY